MDTFNGKRHKLGMAVKAAVAVAAVGLSSATLIGCKEVTKDQGVKVEKISAPKGTIVGVVVDTNGNPIQGAKVSAGGKTTTTDAQGYYTIKNVAATSTVGDGLTGTDHNPIPVSIMPGTVKVDGERLAQYLGGIVQVTPVAQGGAATTCQNLEDVAAGDAECNGDNAILGYFIDGFTASAGTAVLPSLSASLRGTLRDNMTGEPIANTVIALDMNSGGTGGAINQEVNHGSNNAVASYQTFNYTTTTDAEGRFLFERLPADSTLAVEVEGWANPTIANFITDDEAAIRNWGDLFVDRVTSADGNGPFFANVIGVINAAATPGLLGRDIDATAGVVFPLSEAIDPARVGVQTVRVFDNTADQYLNVTAVTVAEDNRSITVTLDAAIPAGNQVDFLFQSGDIRDAAGNVLQVDDAVAPTPIGYDTAATLGYIRVALRGFVESTLPEGIAQLDFEQSDPNGQAEFPLLSASSDALVDNSNVSGFIGQLNSADDDDGLGNDAAERLTDLVAALAGAAGVPAANVDADVARITFTPSSLADYRVEVRDQTGQRVNVVVIDNQTHNLDGVANNNTLQVDLNLVDGHQGQVFFLLDNVQPGYEVSIREVDELGNPGEAATVALADLVPPTTTLQNAYGVGNQASGGVALIYGDGGELAGNSGSAAIGMPTLNITPYLLAQQAAQPLALNQLGALDGLYSGKPTVTATGVALDDGATSYDATAFTAWPVQARTMGVAFSEDVVVNGSPAYDGATVLSNFVANNDVIQNDQSGVVNVDLVNMDVADVMALSMDHGSIIDFAGVVTDLAGNTASADTNARVLVTDRMPPLVTTANYSAVTRALTVSFNEEVSLTVGDQLNLGAWVAEATDGDMTGTTLTFTEAMLDAANGGLPFLTVVDTLDDGNVITPDRRFARMNFNQVEDAQGNAWPFGGLNPQFLVELPREFARAAAPAPSGFVDAAGTFSVVYEFNYAIDLEELLGVAPATPGALNGAEVVAAGFAIVNVGAGTAAIDAADPGTNAALSADGRTLTVNIVTTAALAAEDQFDAPAFTIADAAAFSSNPQAVIDPDNGADPTDTSVLVVNQDRPTIPAP